MTTRGCSIRTISRTRNEAWRAKIRHKSRDYTGRADLLDLAIKTCIELRRVHSQLETLGRLLPASQTPWSERDDGSRA